MSVWRAELSWAELYWPHSLVLLFGGYCHLGGTWVNFIVRSFVRLFVWLWIWVLVLTAVAVTEYRHRELRTQAPTEPRSDSGAIDQASASVNSRTPFSPPERHDPFIGHLSLLFTSVQFSLPCVAFRSLALPSVAFRCLGMPCLCLVSYTSQRILPEFFFSLNCSDLMYIPPEKKI